MSPKRQAADRFTTRQRLLRLIAGSVVFLIVVAPTYFVSQTPEWLIWLIRGFGGLWLLDWWRRHLAGIFRQKHGIRDHPQK